MALWWNYVRLGGHMFEIVCKSVSKLFVKLVEISFCNVKSKMLIQKMVRKGDEELKNILTVG